jgi:hypothetical protein
VSLEKGDTRFLCKPKTIGTADAYDLLFGIPKSKGTVQATALSVLCILPQQAKSLAPASSFAQKALAEKEKRWYNKRREKLSKIKESMRIHI